MNNVDFAALCEQAKTHAGFEPDDERVLVQEAPKLQPHFAAITDAFYAELQTIPEILPFLEGVIDALKATTKLGLKECLPVPTMLTLRLHAPRGCGSCASETARQVHD